MQPATSGESDACPEAENFAQLPIAARLRAVMWLAAAALAVENLPAQPPGRGVIVVQDQAGTEVALYEGSHALLIGESDYTAGWPDLESIPRELAVVEAALEQQGFAVETFLDQGSAALEARVKAFIDRLGYSAGNRLIFFFSGHGHTRRTERYGDRGYFVPVDAPDPSRDERGFLSKAISMDQILTWSRDIEAKHALFLFDSCFSGGLRLRLSCQCTRRGPPR